MNNKYKKILIYLIILVSVFLGFSISFYIRINSKEYYFTDISTNIKLSKEEKKIDDYLSKIKFDADKLYFPAMSYGIIDFDDTVYSKELLDFSRMVPKGGDLHVHSDKFIGVNSLIDLLLMYDDIYVVLDEGDNYGYLYIDDVPSNAISLKKAIKNKKITKEKLKELLVLSNEDTYGNYWKNFRNAKRVAKGLYNSIVISKLIYEEGFRNSCKNNACFLEIRVVFTAHDQVNINRMNILRDAYYNVKDEYPNLVVRVIASSSKGADYPVSEDIDVFRSAIRVSKIVKDEYYPDAVKDFIIGLDLVGEEDKGKSLEEYSDFLSSKEVKKSGLKLFLHAGESLRLDNSEVIDAYLLNATRVGHAFNLYRYPSLMKKYADKKIALEISPMSNYRLGYIHDLRLHPVLTYLQQGIPIVISSDDGLFFSEEPLVYDYYSAILCWNLDLAMIKQISLNNIIYSGLSKLEIKELKENWEKDWDKFVSNMLIKIEEDYD